MSNFRLETLESSFIFFIYNKNLHYLLEWQIYKLETQKNLTLVLVKRARLMEG